MCRAHEKYWWMTSLLLDIFHFSKMDIYWNFYIVLFVLFVFVMCLVSNGGYVFVLFISDCPFGILSNVHVVRYQKLEIVSFELKGSVCIIIERNKNKKTMVYAYKYRISIISTLLSLLIFFNLSSLGCIKCYWTMVIMKNTRCRSKGVFRWYTVE